MEEKEEEEERRGEAITAYWYVPSTYEALGSVPSTNQQICKQTNQGLLEQKY